MKQNAKELLPQTVVKNSIGEVGTLITLQYSLRGKLYWLVYWSGRGLALEPIEKVQEYELT
jgi:hypothetical protein